MPNEKEIQKQAHELDDRLIGNKNNGEKVSKI